MSNLIKRIFSSIVLLPLSYFFITQGSITTLLFTLFLFLIAVYEWQMMIKNIYYKIYGFIFLIISFYTFYDLSNDYLDVFFIILICVSTDVGGYVFGKIFKGPKLTKISPNKTYAGMIGSYILSLFFLTLIVHYAETNIKIQINFFLTIIFISTVSQIGDLIISFFKRKSKIKNTGKIIPGHGGLLDRIDGMIFSFPTFYLINLLGYVK